MRLETRALRCAPILAPIDLTLASGEILGVVGPNGAGKSTLLLALAALRPYEGELHFAGRRVGSELPLRDYRRRVSIAFQQPTLLDRSVGENVALPLSLLGLDRGQAGIWLSRFGVDALASRPARTLSGGEAQRVALARAFATGPDLLLLDEPWNGLDVSARDALEADLAQALADRGASAVLVGHDRAALERLCDRLLVLDAGRALQCGTPAELIEAPASGRVAELLGLSNWIRGTVLPGGAVDWDGLALELGLDLEPGTAVELRIPEDAVVPGVAGAEGVAIHRNAVRLTNGRLLTTAVPLTRGERVQLTFTSVRLHTPARPGSWRVARRIGP